MYEYISKSNKKREKLVVFGLFVLGLLIYGGSLLPHMPIPALIQLLSMAAFVPAAIIAVRCLLTQYVYRVEARDGSDVLDAGRDLVIIEKCGRRLRTVCRIGTETVASMTLVTKENKRTLAEASRGKTVYRYTAELFAQNVYHLELTGENSGICLRILSDEALNTAILFN